jgi:hypothetical protein
VYTVITSALEESGWSTPRHGVFGSAKDAVPSVEEVRWAPGPG